MRYTWRNVAIGGGGYVLDVVCSPLNRDLVYVRTNVGGFYRWNANARSWVPITDGFPTSKSNFYGGEALTVDPFNASTVYIAAGKDVGSYNFCRLPAYTRRADLLACAWLGATREDALVVLDYIVGLLSIKTQTGEPYVSI